MPIVLNICDSIKFSRKHVDRNLRDLIYVYLWGPLFTIVLDVFLRVSVIKFLELTMLYQLTEVDDLSCTCSMGVVANQSSR